MPGDAPPTAAPSKATSGAEPPIGKRKRAEDVFDLRDCLCGHSTFEAYTEALQLSPRVAWFALYAHDVLGRGNELRRLVNNLAPA